YKCEVFYNKNIPTDMLLAFLISKGLGIKKLLKERNLLPLKLNFLSRAREKKEPNERVDSAPVYKLEDLAEFPSGADLISINITDSEFQYLRNPVYNYQYIHAEHANDINVYSVENQDKTYIIKGKSNLYKLIL
ncbi:MAG: hypothetical protein RIM68_01535, partial [Arenibacter sp.]